MRQLPFYEPGIYLENGSAGSLTADTTLFNGEKVKACGRSRSGIIFLQPIGHFRTVKPVCVNQGGAL